MQEAASWSGGIDGDDSRCEPHRTAPSTTALHMLATVHTVTSESHGEWTLFTQQEVAPRPPHSHWEWGLKLYTYTSVHFCLPKILYTCTL